ncbi:MAG: HPr family phosphocarrier protein [Desulfurococcaceae archaeon]
MKASEVAIANKSGLHARPAVRFVQLASKFKSLITICKGSKCVNAKNILQVLSLGVDFGDNIVLKVSGDDEDAALNQLIDLLTNVLPNEDK